MCAQMRPCLDAVAEVEECGLMVWLSGFVTDGVAVPVRTAEWTRVCCGLGSVVCLQPCLG